MTELPRATGTILGSTTDDIVGAAWLLGHDLKSPVAIVISALEMLVAMHETDEKMSSTVNLMRGALAAANREYNMISDLLDLARLETNQYELERYDVDISTLIREILEAESYSLKTKLLKVEVDLQNEPALMVNVDIELFRRVVSAMVDNAIKFTVREDFFRIRARHTGKMVEVQFTDNGRTIFPEFEAHLMERAPQWDKRQLGSRTSVGMGLPFVNAVAKAHGGSFSGKTDPMTKFTSFTLLIPALIGEVG
ncbi:MAG: HAMP domain-containing histidine kinase [Anaerolineae bacterium]|nr:HAMP domain-containing histidine kinase [Anaerolineae bacterium]